MTIGIAVRYLQGIRVWLFMQNMLQNQYSKIWSNLFIVRKADC